MVYTRSQAKPPRRRLISFVCPPVPAAATVIDDRKRGHPEEDEEAEALSTVHKKLKVTNPIGFRGSSNPLVVAAAAAAASPSPSSSSSSSSSDSMKSSKTKSVVFDFPPPSLPHFGPSTSFFDSIEPTVTIQCETEEETLIRVRLEADYYSRLHESEGFDVPTPPPSLRTSIAPLHDMEDPALVELAEFAVKTQNQLEKKKKNQQGGRSLEFVKVIKAMEQPSNIKFFYLTMMVRDVDADKLETCQATVRDKKCDSRRNERKLLLFREVPPTAASSLMGLQNGRLLSSEDRDRPEEIMMLSSSEPVVCSGDKIMMVPSAVDVPSCSEEMKNNPMVVTNLFGGPSVLEAPEKMSSVASSQSTKACNCSVACNCCEERLPRCHRYGDERIDRLVAEYHERVTKSEGFDAPKLPIPMFGGIFPCNSHDDAKIVKLAKFAVNTQNRLEKKKKGKKMEFVKVVKAMEQVVCGGLYYLTIEVRDTNANDTSATKLKICQAKVVDPIGGKKQLLLFREAPLY